MYYFNFLLVYTVILFDLGVTYSYVSAYFSMCLNIICDSFIVRIDVSNHEYDLLVVYYLELLPSWGHDT